MKNRLVGLVAALTVAVGGSLAIAVPAQAATPTIQITKVYYNSPGTDNHTNTSLNAEYVRLTNLRSYAIDLGSWTLRDRSGHVYRFASGFKLAGRHSVYVHTGRGTNTAANVYWNAGYYIWNNTGDTAYLRNRAGSSIDSCTWRSTGSYTNC